MKQIRLIFLRNGAFSARLDQDMENPNRFRLQAHAQLVGRAPTTRVNESRAMNTAVVGTRSLHAGQAFQRRRGPAKHYLGIQH